jgi:Leucine-rich repeat (LRR) protein
LTSLPVEIGNLVNLQDLELAFNNLAGSIPVEIGRLENLERLDLSNNTLSGPIPAALRNLSLLWYLDLSENTGLLCWESYDALYWAIALMFYLGPAEVCPG